MWAPQIENKNNYLGLAWFASLLNAGIFIFPTIIGTYSIFILPTSSEANSEYGILFNYIYIHSIVAFMAGSIFLIKNNKLNEHNFNLGFWYGLIPLLSIPSFIIIFLCIYSVR